MTVGRAGNIETKGFVEYGRIAIGRHLPVRDLVAGLDVVALIVNVARCRAALVDRGRGPAQDLVDRDAHLADADRAQPLELLRVFYQGSQSAGDGAARRLGASWKQQHEKVEQFIIREWSALAAIFSRLELRPDDRRHDIIRQVSALPGDQAAGVVTQASRINFANYLRCWRGDAGVNPCRKLRAVFLR